MSDQPLRAAFLSIAVCEHGTTWVRLHDADENIIAYGMLEPGQSLALQEQMTEELQAWATGQQKASSGGCMH